MERIEIGDGITVPRYAWHRPPSGRLNADGGLDAYQPARSAERSGEADAVRRAFSPRAWRRDDRTGAVQRAGVVWLAPEYPGAEWTWRSYGPDRGGALIDLAKLDPARLRYSWMSEGYVWHLGGIPAEAIVQALAEVTA